MIKEVKDCIDNKVKFFDDYFTITDELKGEMEVFIKNMNELGEKCNSASEFEEKFFGSDLSNQFNSLVSKCQPKQHKMTKEEKKQSAKIAKDMLYEQREEIAKDAVNEATTRVINDAKDEMIAQNRKRMIKDGTFDDYTRTMNQIDDMKTIGGFFKNLFGGKKNKK